MEFLVFGFFSWIGFSFIGATPKSVLELMDVKDLTLAHVKSHLQVIIPLPLYLEYCEEDRGEEGVYPTGTVAKGGSEWAN